MARCPSVPWKELDVDEVRVWREWVNPKKENRAEKWLIVVEANRGTAAEICLVDYIML